MAHEFYIFELVNYFVAHLTLVCCFRTLIFEINSVFGAAIRAFNNPL